jgi:hypothetical protein
LGERSLSFNHDTFILFLTRIKSQKMATWIHFQGFPFPFLNETSLGIVANMVGTPLAYDEQTFNSTKLDYTRICIELDA